MEAHASVCKGRRSRRRSSGDDGVEDRDDGGHRCKRARLEESRDLNRDHDREREEEEPRSGERQQRYCRPEEFDGERRRRQRGEREHNSRWDQRRDDVKGDESDVSLTSGITARPAITSALCPDNDISSCLKFENTFDKSVQYELEFYESLEEDLHEKCSNHGVVEHIYVDINSGIVYVRFDTTRSASKAHKEFDGRNYKGMVIKVTYMKWARYTSMFPLK